MEKKTAIYCPPVLQNHLIEIVGETLGRQDTWLMRVAVKKIIKLDSILSFPKDSQDLTRSVVEMAELNRRMASPWRYFFEEVEREPEPYLADGILFHALLFIVRLEGDLFAYGWLADQVRALGLAINPGDSVVWPITSEFVTIEDRHGNCRPFYRLSS
ncbi:MAG: hypothetical protein ACLQDV_01185 [Candidatus Binataceae bacterium]